MSAAKRLISLHVGPLRFSVRYVEAGAGLYFLLLPPDFAAKAGAHFPGIQQFVLEKGPWRANAVPAAFFSEGPTVLVLQVVEQGTEAGVNPVDGQRDRGRAEVSACIA